MVTGRVIGPGLLAVGLLTGAALAQSAAITAGDVVGSWRLVVTPVERDDLSISFESRDGGDRLDVPVAITAGRNGRLDCQVRGEDAECRIRDGALSIVQAGGGVRMSYTLTARTRGGFSGVADMRMRLLPIGGRIGTVVMSRR